jgi:predicted small lipoprotein YifL
MILREGENFMKRRPVCILLSALLCLSLSGCGKKAPPAASSARVPDSSAAVSAPQVPETPPEPSGVNPLTGEPMEEAHENDRPAAVMLNDLKAAQPQLGISQADLIYEVPAEGGITRMLAVYQSLDGVGNLGSIRSARPYYLELALGHQAFFVHAGGSPEAYRDIAAWDVENLDGVNGGSDAKIFWRDPVRRKNAGYEHSMLTSGEKVLGYLESSGWELTRRGEDAPGQTFIEDGTPAGGTPAERIQVKYSYYKTAAFTYDAGTGRYLASQYGGPYVDGNSGEQVSAVNVLVLKTSIAVIPGDTAGRLRVSLTGGEGTFFCGGRSVPIRWSKSGRSAPITYALADGSPLTLGRGNSYICILSARNGSVTVS